jgi:cysteine desulfurase/selenocysteine lyase
LSLADYRQTEFSESVAQGVYLNHAGVSPAPARVVRAVHDAVALSARNPMTFFMQTAIPAITSVRECLGRLMGVPSEHLALTKNTGQGLALLADGLMLDPGDNVISASCEYPSVVYPWYAQRDRGVETRLVKPRPDRTLSLDDVAALIDDRTRVITLSWVQFGTGFRADLKAWAEFAHAHDLLFFVDVIQGLGVLPLHAAEWGLDAVASGVHKWQLAPSGTGVLYIAPHVLDRLRLVNMGAPSVVDVMKFDPLDFTPKPTAQRYEEGSPNALGFVGLNAALSLLEEAGIENIAARVLALGDYTANALETKGYTVVSPRADHHRAGLVMFTHPTQANDAVLATLTEAGVTAAARGGSLRFSPHFYNTEEEIDRAVAVLP